MRLTILFLLVFATSSAAQSIERTYAGVANRLIDAAVSDSFAYHRLAELTDRFGHRLSGSESLERALDWAKNQGVRIEATENEAATG